MTIDDESSVYVGGLPYDASEDSVRRVFELYGQVVAVKIVNDNTTRGKCYGFVTFRNPRSAIDAMNDMDGRTVDGRVVRVNEVRSRGGRSGFSGERGRGRGRGDRGGGREIFRRDVERGRSWRSRGREHDDGDDRERYHYSDRSVERGEGYIGRSREREYEEEEEEEEKRDGGFVRGGVDSEIVSGSFADRDRERGRNLEDVEQRSSRSREKKSWGKRNRTVESDRDGEMERSENRNDTVEKDRDQHSRRWNR